MFLFLVRIVKAVGVAFSQTAILSILCCLYPNHVSISFSMRELSGGIRLIMGATLGCILYEIGSFNLPFTAVGPFVMIALVAAMLTLQGSHIHVTSDEKNVVPIVRLGV